MTTIHRYVVFETVKVLLAVLLATSLLLTLGGGLREGIRQGLPPLVAVKTVPFLIPEMMRLTIPGSLLFAICTVFGKMSASEEITAIKSLGINPFRIVTPVLILAYLLSLVTFWFYDVCATWSRPNLYHVVATSVDQLAYNALRRDGVFKVGNVTVTVKSVDGEKLVGPKVEMTEPRGRSMVLDARQAVLESVESTGKLRILCYDSSIKVPGQVAISLPDEFVQEIDVRPNEFSDQSKRSPSELRMAVIPRQIEYEQQQVAELEASHREADGSSADEESPALRWHRSRLFRLRAEPQRRLSNGFAVFSFAMIGIPVATWRRSSDNMSVFFTCFAPIALLYYPLLASGESMARKGITPNLSVWLAPAVLTLLGSVLLFRLMRR